MKLHLYTVSQVPNTFSVNVVRCEKLGYTVTKMCAKPKIPDLTWFTRDWFFL